MEVLCRCTGGKLSRSTRTQREPHGGRYWVLRDDSGGTCLSWRRFVEECQDSRKDSVQCGVFL